MVPRFRIREEHRKAVAMVTILFLFLFASVLYDQVTGYFTRKASTCTISSSTCKSPDGSISLPGELSGCLNAHDWKYYKVSNSAGKQINVTITHSGSGCNMNDLYIYTDACKTLYYSTGNRWVETWIGKPSSNIRIGIDGDSSNKNCKWALSVKYAGTTTTTTIPPTTTTTLPNLTTMTIIPNATTTTTTLPPTTTTVPNVTTTTTMPTTTTTTTIPPCLGTDKSCGTPGNCINCEPYDGCYFGYYRNYSCSGVNCTYTQSCTEICCDSYFGNSNAYCSNGVCYAPPTTTTTTILNTTTTTVPTNFTR